MSKLAKIVDAFDRKMDDLKFGVGTSKVDREIAFWKGMVCLSLAAEVILSIVVIGLLARG